jgi:hypothetical protein
LRDALVDDIHADLRETINVGLACPKVTAFDCVLKQAENAVAVVAVILGGVNPSLGSDGVRATRAVVIGKALNAISLLAKSSSSCCPSQPRAHNYDRVLAAISGINQLHLEAAFVPLLLNWI